MLNYYLYRLAQSVALALPVKLAYALAVFLADLHYLLAFRDRRFVKNNLKEIFAGEKNIRLDKISRNVFRNFAKYLVDFFRFERLDRQYISRNIKLENVAYFDQALAKGKGVIVLTAHLGNWELGGVVLAQLGYPFWAVALPHKNKDVDNFFVSQRSRKGVNVIPMGKAVRSCIAALRKNHMLALVGDRDFTEKGLIVDLFGKPMHFPEGPAALSLLTGASIVPGFMLRNPDDSFTLRIEKAVEFTPCGDKEKDLKKIIEIYRETFERYIRTYPDQWYVFRRFWVEQ
ncbi:MAG: lysophospholipid acyltransferase family protein [Candidatus Omnitrophica bacterium]|nr:lysophospholipid acyltransferase family protein [Candidatus Omnitrophota bacterium]MDD5500932.1 lysophospholipid acyltransferase family protein [Candidatus Omnitrophota bacterium]